MTGGVAGLEKRVGGVADKELTVDCLFATWLLWIMTVSSLASPGRLGRGRIYLPATRVLASAVTAGSKRLGYEMRVTSSYCRLLGWLSALYENESLHCAL